MSNTESKYRQQIVQVPINRGVDQIEQPLIEWPTKSRRVMGPAMEEEEEDEVEKELSWRSRLSRGIS